MLDTLFDAMPRLKSVLLGLVIVLLGTKNGRLLFSGLLVKFIRKSLPYVPTSVRYKIIATGLQLPLSMQRIVLRTLLAPSATDRQHILRVQKETWRADWIISYIRKHKNAHGRAEEIAQGSDMVILYIHGGGFHVGFSTEYMPTFLAMIDGLKARNIKASILSVDYSLSPEETYPKAQDDCVNAYRYLVHDLSISPSRIIIAGDSAGGNLAASVLLRIRDQRSDPVLASLPPLPLPAGCALISPWVTFEDVVKSDKYYDDYVRLGQLQYYRANYVPKYNTMEVNYREAFIRQPFISPLYGNFDHFCPTLVTYGGGELIQPQVEGLIEKLKQHQVSVTVITRPKSPHIWIIEPHVCKSKKIWKEDLGRMLDWCASIRRH
ncbi:Alpha/Beta hydrolase protein [Fennellomyces sp. T-0311]|nr:Alpha/Beta hydrolase protein [Fennellomyces sp. T-0311]